MALVLPVPFRSGNLSVVNTPIKNPFDSFNPFPNNIIPASLLSPQAQKALAYMPLPNTSGTNNYLAQTAVGNTTDQTTDRVDQNLGDKARLFFRMVYQNTTLLQGSSNPANGINVPLFDRNYAIGYTHTISPHAVNDFRFGYEKNQYQSVNFFSNSNLAGTGTALGVPGFTTDQNNPGLIDFEITGYLSIGGQNMASSNWTRPSSTFEWTDVLNYTFGAHTIAAGAEFFRLSQGDLGNNSPRGLFTFTGQISGNAPADFLLGLPLQATTPAPSTLMVQVRQWRNAFFVSDKWSATPKLTLTLGLRYELPTVAESPNGTVNTLNKAGTALIPVNTPPSIPLPTVPLTDPQHNGFAPRFGFAYRLAKDWVVRGGYGLYYNANQLNTYTIGGNPPFVYTTIYTSQPASPTITLSNPTAGAVVGASPTPNIVTLQPSLPMAVMNQWSFDVERSLWSGAGLDVQYLGSHTVHLDRSYFNNTPLPGPGPIQARRPNQLWGVIRTVQNDMVANYDGLNVVLRQRLNHGFSMLWAYTWSHTIDVSTDSNNGGSVQDPYNWKGSYGNSNWDIRHRLVVSYSYELPFFKASHGWQREVLGGWQLNGVTTLQSGTPITITTSGDPANTGASSAERPNLIAPASANCNGDHLIGCISTASFMAPQPYTYGNAGRNIVTGPKLVQTDLSLFKNFPIVRERTRVQLRLEAFNVFNTPSFSNPAAVFGTSTFGSITSTLIPNRQVQIAAKILF